MKLVDVVGKDRFQHFRLSEDLLVFPDRLVTRNVARVVDAEPVLKHDVLQHLLLKILVSFTEQSLCNDAFEHENRIHWSTPGSTEFLVGFAAVCNSISVNGVCNLRSVRLKRQQLVELVEDTCALLGSLQEGAIGGKKVLLSGGLAVQSLHNGFFG